MVLHTYSCSFLKFYSGLCCVKMMPHDIELCFAVVGVQLWRVRLQRNCSMDTGEWAARLDTQFTFVQAGTTLEPKWRLNKIETNSHRNGQLEFDRKLSANYSNLFFASMRLPSSYSPLEFREPKGRKKLMFTDKTSEQCPLRLRRSCE